LRDLRSAADRTPISCSELIVLRTKYHETEAETANLSTQSRTMLNMNLKLQNSASKTQARALDLELAKIEAKVAREQVEMVEVSFDRTFLLVAYHS